MLVHNSYSIEYSRHAKVYPNSKRSSDAFIHAQAESAKIVGKRTPKPKLPKGASPPPENKYMVNLILYYF